MITHTHMGLVYPVISVARAVHYEARPVAYMHDLRDIALQHAFSQAINNKAVEDMQEGREFILKATDIANWYTPPKGHHINTWA